MVDDHRTFADLMVLALDAARDLECVGAAYSVSDGLARFSALRPDLVVMDYRFLGSELTGIDGTRQMLALNPDAHVVLLTGHQEHHLVGAAAEAGVSSLLPKDGSLSDLLAVLRAPRPRGLVVHPTLLKTLMVGGARSAEANLPRLTRREREVLGMLMIGLDVRAISGQLGISLNTCRAYVKSVLAKFDAHSQIEVVAMARRRGLVEPPTDALA